MWHSHLANRPRRAGSVRSRSNWRFAPHHYRYECSVLSYEHNVCRYPLHHPNLFADKGELVAAANPFTWVVSTVAFLLSSVFERPAYYSYQFAIDTSFAMFRPMRRKRKKTCRGTVMRVGFLFNHYAVHQVPHAAPYAFELSRKYPDLDVVIACSSRQEMRTVRAIGVLYPGHRCRFKLLRPVWYYRLVDPIVSDSKFKWKEMVLRHNLDFFRTLDALVAPEHHCIRLCTSTG